VDDTGVEESEPVPQCGDGEVEGDEVCDGTDLAGESCASLDPAHFAAGELRCAADCGAFDASACDAGDCCQGGSNQGCEVADIEACVCAQDSFCCETEWDTVCVAEAEDCGMVCP
jgi:hypothetical protein